MAASSVSVKSTDQDSRWLKYLIFIVLAHILPLMDNLCQIGRTMEDRLRAIIDQFQIEGRFASGEAFGAGHIHETYRVVCEAPEGQAVYLLQKINPKVFRNVSGVMAHVHCVTEHLRDALKQRGVEQLERRVLSLVPTRDQRMFWSDPQGQAWRVYPFIENSQTQEHPQSLQQVEQGARALGEFLACLQDLDPSAFQEKIDEYHNGLHQLAALRKAVKKDSCYRLTQARHEVEAIEAHQALLQRVQDLVEPGTLPQRILHGDPKFNNVLFDQNDGQALSMIDLDTVMPGPVLCDFGDMVRTMMTDAAEDEANTALVTLEMERLEPLVRGFVTGVGGAFTPQEIETLYLGITFMPLMMAIRYLTDFLQGDLIYKTHKIRHNLQRCRVQLKLVELLLEQEKACRSLVDALG